MKKILALSMCIALVVLSFATFAGAITLPYTGSTSVTAGTGINDTVHDLRRHNGKLAYNSVNQADYLDRLCIFCHAPHHAYRISTATTGTANIAPADYTYLPLWNHAVTNTVFVPYYNGPDQPIDGMKHSQAIDNFDKIGAASLLCLSCHDGTVAVNMYGQAPQDTRSISTGATIIGDQYKIGGDGYLANHHPIGFNYAAVAAVDLDIRAANVGVYDHSLDTTATVTFPVVQEPIENFLWNGKMECASCHSVHNKGNSGEKLLYVSDQNSNLCFSCHDKGSKTAGVTP